MPASKKKSPGESLPAGLSQPALRALAGAGYATLDQLAKVREADLAKLHGMGPKRHPHDPRGAAAARPVVAAMT
jgi:hypothetical protein